MRNYRIVCGLFILLTLPLLFSHKYGTLEEKRTLWGSALRRVKKTLGYDDIFNNDYIVQDPSPLVVTDFVALVDKKIPEQITN